MKCVAKLAKLATAATAVKAGKTNLPNQTKPNLPNQIYWSKQSTPGSVVPLAMLLFKFSSFFISVFFLLIQSK